MWELEQQLARPGLARADRESLVDRLNALGLPGGEWAVFGSGPLLLRGWIDEAGDIDIITRGHAWDRAQQLGSVLRLEDGSKIIDTGDGITLGTSWLYGNPDIDHLIDTAEIVAGVPCVRLEHVAAYKQIADRPKDRAHRAIIDAHP